MLGREARRFEEERVEIEGGWQKGTRELLKKFSGQIRKQERPGEV